MDLARQLNTGPSGASAEVQAQHWHEALASLTDVSNTIRLELSQRCSDAMPTATGAMESKLVFDRESEFQAKTGPLAPLPRLPSTNAIEPGLRSAPQSAWSHSCENGSLPKLRGEPPHLKQSTKKRGVQLGKRFQAVAHRR